MRVLSIFVVLGLLLSIAPVQAEPDLLETSDPVMLQGQAELIGTSGGFWLTGDARNALIEIKAPVIDVLAYHHEAYAEVGAAGQDLFEGSPLEPKPTRQTYQNVRTYLEAADATALLKAAWLQAEGALTVSYRLPGPLYPDVQGASIEGLRQKEVGAEDYLDTFDPPAGQFVTVGRSATVEVDCDPQILVRGMLMRLTHDDGSSLLDSRITTEGIDGPNWEATVSSWTDHVLTAPEGATIRIVWPAQALIFGGSMQVQATEGLSFGRVEADEPGLDGLVLAGPTRAAVAAVEGASTRWDVRASATATSSATPLDGPAGALLLVGSALGALIVVGALRVMRRRPAEPSPAKADTPIVRGMRLYHDHRFKQALQPLKQAVMDAPDDHELRYALGVSLLRTGHFKEAFGHLRNAVRRMPIMLQMLVTSPETEAVRADRRFEAFIREEARVFKDTETTSHFGYC